MLSPRHNAKRAHSAWGVNAKRNAKGLQLTAPTCCEACSCRRSSAVAWHAAKGYARNATKRNATQVRQHSQCEDAQLKKSQCARPTVADESTMGERTRTPEAFEGGTTGDTHRSHGMQVGLGLAGHLRRCYKLRLQRKRRL